MSFFGIFGNKISGALRGSRDNNSQTDFELDDDVVTDGHNIGIRVDPRPSNKRNFKKPDKARDAMPDTNNPEKMMMAERVFYGQADTDEQWNVHSVNSTVNEDVETKAVEKEQPCIDPCDPCQKYKSCMQQCMTQDSCDARADPIEADRREVKEARLGRRQCNDPCRSNSRGREEKKHVSKSDKPRRQCSDLCRVTKKRQQQPAEDPCNDPCADPCQTNDPCADVSRDPCFDANAHESCNDPCARSDPCNDPCRGTRQKSNQCNDPCRGSGQRSNPCPDPCYDPCKDPCRDPCQDPCPELCPTQDPCDKEQHEEHGDHSEAHTDPKSDHVGEAAKDEHETQNKEACIVCPACPPCPPCPQCPECPACPPCPSPPTNKSSYRSCNTSSSSIDRVTVQQVKDTKEAPEEKPACPDPLFPSCKSSEESCQSIVCPEGD